MEIKATSYRFTINILIRVYSSNSCSKRGHITSTFTYWIRYTRLEQTVH
jgi:hypothetical protein